MKRLILLPLTVFVFVACSDQTVVNPEMELTPALAVIPTATTYELFPTGDLNLDADIIQDAIDAASPGDVLILKSTNSVGIPTPWILGKTTSDDILIQAANGTFWWNEDYHDKWGTGRYITAQPETGGYWQDINIHTSITLRGETDGTGVPLTVVTVPPGWEWEPIPNPNENGPHFTGVPGTFVVNALDVTIEGIRFEELTEPIWTFSPGFDIKNNEFHRCVEYYLVPDVNLSYPRYPAYHMAVQSYFRNNKVIDSGQAPHVVGSEVVVIDNEFDIESPKGFGFGVLPWGHLSVDFPINWTLVRNNIISGNTIDMNEDGFAIHMHTGFGGEISDNTVANNVIENCGTIVPGDYKDRGISLCAFDGPIKGNIIAGNTIEGCRWGIRLRAVDEAFEGNIIAGNTIESSQRPIRIYAYNGNKASDNMVISNRIVNNSYNSAAVFLIASSGSRVSRNWIALNDYRESNNAGWHVRAGAIGLSSGTFRNMIVEHQFPTGTSVCEQVLDHGKNNWVEGFDVCEPLTSTTANLSSILEAEELGELEANPRFHWW